jgi:hypothetical protein
MSLAWRSVPGLQLLDRLPLVAADPFRQYSDRELELRPQHRSQLIGRRDT